METNAYRLGVLDKIQSWMIHLFYKKPAYKQIAYDGKLLSNFQGPTDPLSISKNSKYRLKKLEFFLFNKRNIIVKRRITKIQKALLGKF